MKHSYIDITDQFCGAGGSSQGSNAVTPPAMEWLVEKGIESLM